MAEHSDSTPASAARRRTRRAPAQLGNVVTLPKRLTGTDAIVAEVTGRSKWESESLLEQMRSLQVVLDARHRERANELVPIGVRMCRPMLDDFIEIGRRMLAREIGS